jgi:hypothetical protein
LYPIPTIEDATRKLQGAKYFSVLVCNEAFNQITLHENSRECDPRIVVPPCLRQSALSLANEGHLGVTKPKQQIRTKLWWSEMDNAVETKCNWCPSCQLVCIIDSPEPIVATAVPDHLWEYIGVNHLGPLPNRQYIHVVVDYYSCFVEVIFIRSTTSESTISHLSQIFTHLGVPQRIRVDRGPQFVSQEFRDFCNQISTNNNIQTPSGQRNGEVERQNRSLLKRLKFAYDTGENLKLALQQYLMAYKPTPHAATDVSPAKLFLGTEMRVKFPSLASTIYIYQEERDNDAVSKAKISSYADQPRPTTRPS